MQDSYAHCEALVREADKDRFLASLFAPADRRPHLHALHAFNVEIARVGLIAREPLAGEIRLQWWRDALSGAGHGEVRANPVAAALLDTIARCALPISALTELIDAHGAALYPEPLPTLAALEEYALKTAVRLFELGGVILGHHGIASAGVSAGLAYGLVGTLKAFPFDAARGRLILPLDMLDRHAVARGDVLAGKTSVGLAAALAELRARARGHLAEAEREWKTVALAVAPVLLPAALVEPLLARMEKKQDPFAPVDLPQWRRQWLLWRAARRGLF